MRLTCPNNVEHKTFVLTAMVLETWLLNEDGDCEDIFEAGGPRVVESDLSTARCEECDTPVVFRKEE